MNVKRKSSPSATRGQKYRLEISTVIVVKGYGDGVEDDLQSTTGERDC